MYYCIMEVRQIAINFIKTLSPSDKEKLKVMLTHGITCGADYARQNEIEPLQLTEELKLIFGGK